MSRRYVMRLRRPRFRGTRTPFVTPSQSARRLVILAAVAAGSTVAFWMAMTQTLLGQQVADLILYGRTSAPSDVLGAATEALATVSLVFVGLAALGLATVALTRGGVWLAVAVVMLLVGANLTTHGLKAFLERPNLLGDVAYATGNSFPSGHVTLVSSLGLACILVAPRRLRTAVAVGSAVLIAVVGASTIIAGWHRLADVEGAIAISLAWASLVTAVLVVSRGWVPRRTWGRGLGGRVTSLGAIVGAIAVAAGAIGVTLAIVDPTPFADLIRSGPRAPWTFAAAISIQAGTALIASIAYVWAMLGVALERPG
jgi:PAP2 superfamily.